MPTASELRSTADRFAIALRLRQPQNEALLRLVDLLEVVGPNALAKPPSELATSISRVFGMTGSPLAEKLRGDRVALTFDLATGVGKSKLAAAIMGVLHSAGLCSSFWVITPRRGIADKFVRELSPLNPRYMLSGVPDFEPPTVLPPLAFSDATPLLEGKSGARIAVATAQWITRGEQICKRSEVTGRTPIEEMRSRGPVVAIIDESHHFDSKVWSTVPDQLDAAIVIKLTATPTADEAVLYSYPLGKCLREGIYTKRPVLQIQTLAANYPVKEADRIVLRDALACLDRVEPALRDYAGGAGVPSPPAIALVAARDTEHANEVGRMLETEFGLAKEQVLVFHSKSLSDETLARLLAVEAPASKVRVVVQVFALEEGWDVSNVFVIAPLREMATYRGIRQLMGRGLRLPFGKRTTVEEIDSLTVLAYGRSTVAQVVREATQDLGRDAVSFRSGMLEGESKEQLETLVACVEPDHRGRGVQWPQAEVVPECGNIDLSELRAVKFGRSAGRLDLQSLDLLPRFGLDDLSDTEWSLAVTHAVVRSDRRLSILRHGPELRKQIACLLRRDSALRESGKRVAVPDAVELILDCCGSSWQSVAASYSVLKPEFVHFRDREFTLRSTQPRPISPALAEVHARNGTRCPATGFRKSVVSVGLFDSGAEVRMAQALDGMSEVEWWLRNDPRQLSIPTTDVADASPDFVAQCNEGSSKFLLVLEVKGRDLWGSRNSQARRQARDMRAWSSQTFEASGIRTLVAFLGHDDVDRVSSIGEIRMRALDPDS